LNNAAMKPLLGAANPSAIAGSAAWLAEARRLIASACSSAACVLTLSLASGLDDHRHGQSDYEARGERKGHVRQRQSEGRGGHTHRNGLREHQAEHPAVGEAATQFNGSLP